MIVVKLIGGLGNQMFQYAAGKALAEKHGVDLKLDLSYLKLDTAGKYTPRSFELSIFKMPFSEVNESEKRLFFKKGSNRLQRLLYRRYPNLFKRIYAAENASTFQKNFNSYPANTYLDGFWQSELYFSAFNNIIRKDFSFKEEIIEIAQECDREVMGCNSVSLHVRRGDYVNNNDANVFHGLCSPEYYRRAVEYISRFEKDLCLFVFSDDINWCKENLKFDFPTKFMGVNNAPAEMYLMSHCKHNVIANSSFSWWGAWLNTNQKKIVIAPEYWFSGKKSRSLDILPENWIVV